MPYVSDKQRRWAHTPSAKRKGFPTAEFDREERMQNADRKPAFWMPDEEKPKGRKPGRKGRLARLKKRALKKKAAKADAKQDALMGAMMGAVHAR